MVHILAHILSCVCQCMDGEEGLESLTIGGRGRLGAGSLSPVHTQPFSLQTSLDSMTQGTATQYNITQNTPRSNYHKGMAEDPLCSVQPRTQSAFICAMCSEQTKHTGHAHILVREWNLHILVIA